MKYVIANWKMNLTARESVALVRGVLRAMQGRELFPGIVLCPSFTALAEVHKLVTRTHIQLGAQNAGPDRAGALTGEIGLAQLEDTGCTYALVGHSERRLRFHEDDTLVHDRLAAVLGSSLMPVVCVGESQETRSAGQAETFVLQQLKRAFANQKIAHGKKILVAYEPVWAIGSGTPATPVEAVAMHKLIREYMLNDLKLSAEEVAVIYGGSVDATNAYQFLREPEIDGVLVGGASLKIKDFELILDAAVEVMEAQA
jgi:triosephosphate isomerase (TIM)